MLKNENIHLLLIAKENTKTLNEYFGIIKGNSTVINYVPIGKDKLIVSLFALLDIMLKATPKIKNMLLYELNKKNNLIRIEDQSDLLKSIESKFEFVLYNSLSNKFFKTKLEFIFKYSKLEDIFYKYFYDTFESFETSDSYLNIEECKLSFNAFGILHILDINDGLNYSIDDFSSEYKKGDRIILINSCLSVISFSIFSSNFSFGNISSLILKDTLLLDVKVLPSSTLSNIYLKKTKKLIGVTLPMLVTKNTYTPIIFALKIDYLLNYFNKLFNLKGFKLNNLSLSFKKERKISQVQEFDKSLEKGIFILHYSYT